MDRLKQAYGVEIRWTAFPLHPDTPEDGLLLEDLFAGRDTDVRQMQERLRRVSLDEGLPFGDRKKTFNTRLAQELAKWAESEGRGDEFHDAVFRAYFSSGKNIARIGTLVEVAGSVGLSGEKAQSVLRARTFRADVDKDWVRSRALGVTAVPTFRYNDLVVVGAQPYETLARLIEGR